MNIFVKPKQGLIVRDPRTGQKLKAEGQEVFKDTYWTRRLYAGEVVIGRRATEKVKRSQADSE